MLNKIASILDNIGLYKNADTLEKYATKIVISGELEKWYLRTRDILEKRLNEAIENNDSEAVRYFSKKLDVLEGDDTPRKKTDREREFNLCQQDSAYNKLNEYFE